jgi:hypothetical protein
MNESVPSINIVAKSVVLVERFKAIRVFSLGGQPCFGGTLPPNYLIALISLPGQHIENIGYSSIGSFNLSKKYPIRT